MRSLRPPSSRCVFIDPIPTPDVTHAAALAALAPCLYWGQARHCLLLYRAGGCVGAARGIDTSHLWPDFDTYVLNVLLLVGTPAAGPRQIGASPPWPSVSTARGGGARDRHYGQAPPARRSRTTPSDPKTSRLLGGTAVDGFARRRIESARTRCNPAKPPCPLVVRAEVRLMNAFEVWGVPRLP